MTSSNLRSTKYMQINIKLSLITVIALLAFISTSYAADMTIQYSKNKLSANIIEIPLNKVLEKLSATCGFTILMNIGLKQKNVSVHFENISLEEGIKKIIKPYSSAIIFSKLENEKDNDFLVKELKIFDPSNMKNDYILVGDIKMKGDKQVESSGVINIQNPDKDIKVVPLPNRQEIVNPAKSAAIKKQVSHSIQKTIITKKMTELRNLEKKMRGIEENRRREIQQLKEDLKTASKEDAQKLKSRISSLMQDIKSTRTKNDNDLKRLKSEIGQLRKNSNM